MNTSLAVSPNILAAYFLNILDGKSMREIGRLQDCQASTVLRRIRKCEDLREHPEWNTLFTALEDHQEDTGRSISAHLSRETILAALKLNAADIAKEFPPQLQLLQQAESLLLVGGMPSAAVTVSGAVRGKMRRSVALTGLAFGWLVPVGAITGKVRQFKPTPSAIECTGRDFVSTSAQRSKRSSSTQAWRSSSLEVLHRQNPGLVTANHMRIARDSKMIYLGQHDVTRDVYSVVRQRLAPRLLTALEEVCGKSTGLETLETLLKIPARYGKAVVALALETLDHTAAQSGKPAPRLATPGRHHPRHHPGRPEQQMPRHRPPARNPR